MVLRDFVNKKIASADKEASAQGYPLELSNCKKYKPMRDLKIYGNSYQSGTPSPETPIEVQSVGELVIDEADVNFGKYKISVVQRGINLFNKNKVSGGYINDANGEYRPVADGTCYASDYIEIPPNQKFYITHTETHQWAAAYDENKQFVKGMYGYGSAKTMPSNAKYIRITVRADYIDTMQVQLGSVSTEYEPYIEPVITNIFLDEPLRKLGDYADYIDFKENKVVRKCVKKYLSNYNWMKNNIGEFSNGSYGFYADDRSIVPDYVGNLPSSEYGFSNVFPITHSTSNWATYTFALWVATWATNVRIVIPAEYLSEKSVSALNTWLKEKDAYAICIRKTPREEPLNIDLPKLNAKTTIIEVDTSLAPSNTYGKYIKK